MPATIDDDATSERVDLHVHSTWSSGFLGATDLVRAASIEDIRTLAITDHHETGAFREAAPLAARLGVDLIPAVELDCLVDGRRVDLLGYWIDPEAPLLRAFVERWPSPLGQLLANERVLQALGDALGVREWPWMATGGSKPATYVDLLTSLVEAHAARTIGDAYRRVRAQLRPGGIPLPIARRATVAEGAAVLRAAGGVVALAHPALIGDDVLVDRLVAERLVDAVETPYAGYWADGDEHNATYRRLAERHGVPTAAGSDYHAYPFSPVRLGVVAPLGTLAALRVSRG